MAAKCAGTQVSKDWLKAADEYQKLADAIPTEDVRVPRMPFPTE
jgi:hypothetical protein